MSSAEGIVPPLAGVAAAASNAPAMTPPRRRLFRKYALLLVGLVGAALLVTSGFDFWFSYQETKAALIRLQQEKALAAAERIEGFIDEIERQIGWTTHAQWAASPLDQRRQDYFRLLRQVPAITEVRQLDAAGQEQLKVSRLAMDAIGSAENLSQSPAFLGAKADRLWFSPVYFRKQSEPYVTMAIAHQGRNAGVTVAEINLKLIWDVINDLKIGRGGYAYVVGNKGRLIAHPDISLVLRGTELSGLPQVAAALAQAPGPGAPGAGTSVTGDRGEAAVVVENLAGKKVLSAHAPIAPLGWSVFVEAPLSEAFAPLYGAALRTGLLLAGGLAVAILLALVLARRMTGPIHAIAAGAERFGAGDFGRRIEVDTGDELEALAGQFNRMAGDLQKSYAELEQRVAERTAELSEALEQQTATAEVLGVINSSPGDLAPVFDAILEKAHSLCGADHGHLTLYSGGHFHAVAFNRMPDEFAEILRRPFKPAHGIGERLLAGEPFVQIEDMAALTPRADDEIARAAVERGRIRTLLFVPLRKDKTLLGHITAHREEVRPFTDKQIALLQNFAAQAVIAIENARLITETREALEQQTATAEVLQVINSSPGDLAPVFDEILDKAMRLCEADVGQLHTREGEEWQTATMRGLPPAYAEYRARTPPIYGPGTGPARIMQGESVVHIKDIADSEAYRAGEPARRALADLGGAHSYLAVALRKDATLLGAITIFRQEVRPFSDKQIALVQNFAAQAVIAMENARLITETREALEQQTATAEVLQVINSSPGDLAPVFEVVLDKATQLCDAAFGLMRLSDGDQLRVVGTRNVPAEYANFLAQNPMPAKQGGIAARIADGEPFVHIVDLMDDDRYRRDDVPTRRAMVDLGGARTSLSMALKRDRDVLGAIHIYRHEVRPFTDKQIALLQNFAAQAVIAIENARLMTETREALEQQTATAEVLQVINSSPGDLAPVFDAILEKAHTLCGAAHGHLTIYDGKEFRAVATHGLPEAFAELLHQPFRPGLDVAERLFAGEVLIHIPDMASLTYAPSDRIGRGAAELAGVRTLLIVPLRKDGALLGYMTAHRREVRPFTDKQIALLQNFAAQAVIAMENARLITETREALEQQTATAEVLQVINSSPGDLAPVFDAMLDKALRLCEADFGMMNSYDGERFHYAADRGLPEAYARFRRRRGPTIFGPGTTPARLVAGENLVHTVDLMATESYQHGDPDRRAMVDVGHARSHLTAALRKGDLLLGDISVYRQEVQPFTDKQIALLQNFAAQAVIAIENARLLIELRERTDELARSVEELKALSEVGQAVSATLDVGAVLSTILDRSVALTDSDAGAIFRYRRRTRSFRLFEAVGWDDALTEQIRQLDIPEDATRLGNATERRVSVQIPDLERRAGNPLRDITLAAGYHSVLIVPLVGPDRIFGAIVLQRRAPGEFPEASVRLMQTIASQSALAIQNARLFREIAEKSEQLAEASRHKSQFLANMSHELRTPLNAILGYAELLADGIYGELAPRASGVLERVQNNGRHLLALINDVLDLSKIEAGQLVFTLEDYSLAEVVQSVVSATEGMARNKGLAVTAEIAPGLPTGHADARRLQQVLLNLVGNAVKFTDEGEVAIRAAAEHGSFVLSVRDTGPGIDPEDHGRIFDEFQQVDSSNTRKKGGTGLGLAISKRMIEMQGGTISVDSALGEGATFGVVLPIRVEEIIDEAAGASGRDPAPVLRGAA